jgi:Flp pilus assembly protein TadG
VTHVCKSIRVIKRLQPLWKDTGANQLAEFAVVLPLLVFVAVGIFDFGAAFTVKEKLIGITQTAARVGANQPANDLTVTSTRCSQLVSVCVVRDVVDRALLDNKLKDCGLATTRPASSGNLTWTITANTGCATALVLKIERGYVYNTTLSPPFDTTPLQIVATRVTLAYPYQWQFNKVVGLLGGTFTGPAQLTTVAVMQNLN